MPARTTGIGSWEASKKVVNNIAGLYVPALQVALWSVHLDMPLLWAGGLVTWETAVGVAMAFPLLGLGVWLGGRQFLAASPSTFRRFAVMLLLTLSVLGLLRAIIRI